MSTLPLGPSLAAPAAAAAGLLGGGAAPGGAAVNAAVPNGAPQTGAVRNGAAQDGAGAPAGAPAGGTFAALMAAALVEGTTTPAGGTAAAAPETPGALADEDAPADPTAPATGEVPVLPGLTTYAVSVGSWSPGTATSTAASPAATPATATTAVTPAVPAAGEGTATNTGTGSGTAPSSAPSAAAALTSPATGPQDPAIAADGPSVGGVGSPASTPSSTSGGRDIAAATAPTADRAAGTGPAPESASADTTSAPAPAPAPASGSAAAPTAGAIAPVAPSSPVATTTPPTTTPTPAPVVDQVLPEVVRLVSSASTPTTQRVTLQLAPEALGEVRVVLSIRDGAVQVSLAAGQEAQQALLEGTPELRRLLEATGAGDLRIVVRDLATATQTSPPATAGNPGQPGAHADSADLPQSGDQAGGEWNGRGDQHAGTRGGSNAKDGAQDVPHPGGRPIDPVTGARAGIDVTV